MATVAYHLRERGEYTCIQRERENVPVHIFFGERGGRWRGGGVRQIPLLVSCAFGVERDAAVGGRMGKGGEIPTRLDGSGKKSLLYLTKYTLNFSNCLCVDEVEREVSGEGEGGILCVVCH